MTHLLVPMHLAALVERVERQTGAESYAATGFRPADLTSDVPRRQQIHPDPFAEREPRASGVHLHWSLPDALARFNSEAKRFPRLPCRWVVIRSSGPAAPGAREVKAWLLADIHRTPVSVIPLPGSVPAVSGAANLDITGPDRSDPSWFAYYDNTLERLAFYDDLSDVQAGPLSYVVCGWYQRKGNDPLRVGGALQSEAALRARLAELGWGLDGALHELPSESLFHGTALAIGWPSAGFAGDGGGTLLSERDARPEPSSLRLGLGDRTSAVLSALLSEGDPHDAQLLELLLGGELRDLSKLDGAQLVAAYAHRDRFVAAAPPALDNEIVFTPSSLADPSEPAPQREAIAPRFEARSVEAGGLLDADAAARSGVVSPVEQQPFRRATSPAPDMFAEESPEADLDPGSFERVFRPRPRSYLPQDPQLVVLGAGRAYRHGEDGRFGRLGFLPCRVAGSTLSVLGRPGQSDGVGRELLPKQLGTDQVLLPTAGLDVGAALEALVVEAHTLDPALNPHEAELDPLAQLRVDWIAAEARRSLPGAPPGAPPPEARVVGRAPAPLAITLPERPWYPLHVDWSVKYAASPHAVHDWKLDDLDFEPRTAPSQLPTRELTGRAFLTPAPARYLADALTATLASLRGQPDGQAAIDQLVELFGAEDEDDLLARFTHSDAIGAGLTGYFDRLRGAPAGTWIDKSGMVMLEPARLAAERGERYLAAPLVAGTFKAGRMRFVDTFGRTLLVSETAAFAIPESQRHPDAADIALQRPRFTAPATVTFRYIQPSAAGNLAGADVEPGQTPLVGLLAPSRLDDSLEVYRGDGGLLGRLRRGRTGAAVWEPSPGRGIATAQVQDDVLRAWVEGIVRSDAAVGGTRALSSLRRAIEITSLTIDRSGKAGDQHLQALLAEPVAMMRARVRISLDDAQRDPAWVVSVPARFGSIGNVYDGLVGFYLTERPDRLHLVHSAVAEVSAHDDHTHVITEREADTSGIVWVDLDRDLDVLLLVVPGCDVSLTTGLAPSKVLEMQREWTEPALRDLTPTLRFGAVIRDPQVARMPVAMDAHGTWNWLYRKADLSWAEEDVQGPTLGQLDEAREPTMQDGYLRVLLQREIFYQSTPLQIIAVRRDGHSRSIRDIRVRAPNGKLTDFGLDEAVQLALSGRFAFFTAVDGFPRANVVVDQSGTGRKFLRTESGGGPENNLYQLPSF
jgi:hypothetical protein